MVTLDKYSYCGFSCENCPIYYKNKEKNDSQLDIKNIDEKIKKEFADKICYGCKEESEIKFHKDCNIALCAEKRGISFCGLCPDFPCVFYSNFTTEAIDRIYEIKKEILEKNII